MLVAALALRLAGRGETFSHRVVVGAIGCGAPCDGRVARALASELSGLGFDAVAPSGLDGPQAVREFARDHGARFGVALRVAVEQSTALDDAAQRVRANAALYVIDAESDEPPNPSFVLRGIEEAKDEQTALSILALRLLRGLSPVTGSALLASEPVRAMQQNASGLEQQAAALSLKRREKDLLAREEAIREYRMHCESNDEALSAVDGARCVSDGCAEEYLIGVLPDGSAAVVHDSTDAAVFPLAPDSTARGFMTSERIWLVPRQGRRTMLAEAANFYSRPDLSADGGTLAYVEYRLGNARLYAQRVASGERVLIQSVALPLHLSEPRLSADGAQLLYYELSDGRGRAALRVADTTRPERSRELLPHALDARFVRLRLAPDAEPRTFVAALVPKEPATTGAASPAPQPAAAADATAGQNAQAEPDADTVTGDDTNPPFPALLLVDPASGAVVAAEHELPHRVRAIGDAYGESLLLSFEDRSCGFARYTPGRPITWTRTEPCPKHIATGAGGVFAHALGGAYRQLVRLDVEAGRIELLTKGTQDVQNPKPAATGRGLAYERVMPRKYGELQHVAVCFDDR